jgi:hypothetical protein
MALFPLGILSAAGAGGAPFIDSDYELISSTILGSSSSSISFSSLGTYSSTYKHLQIRAVMRNDVAATGVSGVWTRFNGDTAGNYAWHILYGTGSSVASTAGAGQGYALTGLTAQNSMTASSFSAVVIDYLDVFSTTKNKTTRAFTGNVANETRIDLHSGHWRSTASVTSIELSLGGSSFITGSRFSLYGIKG